MQSLSPYFKGYLDGMCAGSCTVFSQGGMTVDGPHFGELAPLPPESWHQAKEEELPKFFVTVFGDTAVRDARDGQPIAHRFLELLAEEFPDARLVFRLPTTRGWYDGLEVWAIRAEGTAYLALSWSVS